MHLKNCSYCLIFSIITLSLWTTIQNRCMYDLTPQFVPVFTNISAFEIGSNLQACKDYIEPGRLGCCSKYNDKATLDNFKQIDGIFGAQGGGCDICAINVKRFWCQYACSARQDEFMEVAKELEPFPDPQKPGNIIWGQRVDVRVHADTACALYESCKRNPRVASGQNALDGGRQFITMTFSYNKSDSLTFSSELHDYPYEDLYKCEYKTEEKEIHTFPFTEECDCNSCEAACDPNKGFIYTEPTLFEGFNVTLVLGALAGSIGISVLITIYRHFSSKKKHD